MDVATGMTRTHTHTTNFEYETRQQIHDGVLRTVVVVSVGRHVYLWTVVIVSV
jgi:hypothetical protein